MTLELLLTGLLAASAAPQPVVSPRAQAGGTRHAPVIFGRVGWARFTDDEGSLGDGTSVGFGVIVPLTRRFGIQVAYDRHDHRRDFEPVGPLGATTSGGFSGTEQLVTAKALFFFLAGHAVRPYAGIGVGFLDSRRVSEFPTFVFSPEGVPLPGPAEIFTYHTRGAGLGFAAGVDARVTDRISVIGDLTLDLSSPDALGSTRLTVGAGWRF
ncbi:MAG TPA: outer membrane beta-barrel protein [Vicinamibacterales bacterium]|nr:outer membrane beta-barrel protein [Vicinamibacterales bacterium]